LLLLLLLLLLNPFLPRCHRMAALTVPEAKDCARAAAIGLEYKLPRPMQEFSIQRQVDEAVDKMMVRGLGVCEGVGCFVCLGQGVRNSEGVAGGQRVWLHYRRCGCVV
jgi:hypothetical protein